MTDDRSTSGSSAGVSGQQFIVEHEGRVYRTTGVEEVNPNDEQIRSALNSGDAGRAIPYSGGSELSYKSAEPVSFANINPSEAESAAPQTFANINPSESESAAPQTFANINPNEPTG